MEQQERLESKITEVMDKLQPVIEEKFNYYAQQANQLREKIRESEKMQKAEAFFDDRSNLADMLHDIRKVIQSYFQ